MTADAKRTAGLGALTVALAACTVWLSVRHSSAKSGGEAVLDLPLICAACGHIVRVDYDGLLRFASESQTKGSKAVDGGPRSPVGICPRCGQAQMYRAEEDARTEQPVLPEFVRHVKETTPMRASPATR